jgi:hypothetical protein
MNPESASSPADSVAVFLKATDPKATTINVLLWVLIFGVGGIVRAL